MLLPFTIGNGQTAIKEEFVIGRMDRGRLLVIYPRCIINYCYGIWYSSNSTSLPTTLSFNVSFLFFLNIVNN